MRIVEPIKENICAIDFGIFVIKTLELTELFCKMLANLFSPVATLVVTATLESLSTLRTKTFLSLAKIFN